VVLAVVFISLFFLEQAVPLRKRTRSLIGRLGINLLLTALAFGIASLSVKPVSRGLMAWTGEHSFGLLNWLHLSGYGGIIAGFLLMDMTFYWWHRVNHQIPLLWRFHAMHHNDPDLDISTSFRFHVIEIFLSSGFRALQVGIIGLSPLTYLFYEFVFTCGTMFHHSNYKLPIGLERALNMVFVTPRMHGIHHSEVPQETNSNYSVVFRWWDVLFGTVRLNVHQAAITIGVPGYSRPEDNSFGRLFAMPFRRQKEYWVRPDATLPSRTYMDDAGRTALLE
jgi:sterol desaturase/sphingolipid hydroxylase (fatty acid hydroxylase superfamily)